MSTLTTGRHMKSSRHKVVYEQEAGDNSDTGPEEEVERLSRIELPIS